MSTADTMEQPPESSGAKVAQYIAPHGDALRAKQHRWRCGCVVFLVALTLAGAAGWHLWGVEAYNRHQYVSDGILCGLISYFWDTGDLMADDQGFYPGLARLDGKVRTDDHACDFVRGGVVTNGGTTRLLDDSGRVQTFMQATDGGYAFFPSILDPVKDSSPISRRLYTGENHVSQDIERDPGYLLGGLILPSHVQYISGSGLYDDMWIAYGCFGDGDGLPAGTGEAELWLRNRKRLHRIRWERYRPQDGCREQVLFASGDEYKGDPKAPNRCYIPPTAELMSEDPVVFEQAVEKMRECGWEYPIKW